MSLPFFYATITEKHLISYFMDKDKLKLITRNLELLIDALKVEIYSDTTAYTSKDKKKDKYTDYDEIFDDDDGYPD